MTETQGLSWQFTHAIVRLPAATVADGLRAIDAGDPTVAAFRAEHDIYVDALRAAGLAVDVLPALDDYPDSCFVEDPAFCLPEGAILLRPGAPSRRGEGAEILEALEQRFDTVLDLPGSGHVDGGDILTLDDMILIGLSARTDQDGAEAFAELLRNWGYVPKITRTPQGVLHFKTACATLGEGTVLATRTMIDSGIFDGIRLVEVPADEEYAANVIRVNDVVLVPEGYQNTKVAIESAGFETVEVPTHEARKLDGGLSCLSLRFAGS